MKQRVIQRTGDVASLLRAQVVSGRYAPGQQLPTRSELVRELGSSSHTVQAALDVLTREGFFRTEARVGTFVAAYPPHLHDYALVSVQTTEQLNHGSGSRYPRLLLETAQQYPAEERRRFKIFDGVDSRTLEESFHRLRADLYHRRLAGVIKTCRYHAHGLMEQSTVPWVLVDSDLRSDKMFTVGQCRRLWTTAAAERLRSLGRQRVAIIGNSTASIESTLPLAEILREHGLTVLPEHIQSAHPASATWARSITHLLLSQPQSIRPDAILITDDSLTEHALCGVLDRGMRSPADLEIIAHASFPTPAPTILPVTRLGWDLRQTLLTAVDMIDQCNVGALKPCHVALPVYFESQVPEFACSALQGTPISVGRVSGTSWPSGSSGASGHSGGGNPLE